MRFEWLEPQVFQQLLVFVWTWVRSGQQLFTNKDGIGAGDKTECSSLGRKVLPTCGQTNARLRHENPRCGDRAHHLERIQGRGICQRSAFDAHEHVNGYAFRMWLQRSELM